ncbi:hypothetical protein VNO78_05602 [Psophocarpus tetragonolobus]|uniref:Uncharacterized protein n=1 Tax=Psophocarpus tetragonolobus TaxID=3891 RepID=A0AAN9XQJ3_PSOTE
MDRGYQVAHSLLLWRNTSSPLQDFWSSPSPPESVGKIPIHCPRTKAHTANGSPNRGKMNGGEEENFTVRNWDLPTYRWKLEKMRKTNFPPVGQYPFDNPWGSLSMYSPSPGVPIYRPRSSSQHTAKHNNVNLNSSFDNTEWANA